MMAPVPVVPVPETKKVFWPKLRPLVVAFPPMSRVAPEAMVTFPAVAEPREVLVGAVPVSLWLAVTRAPLWMVVAPE